jgi:lysine-specific demethylase/histidyl-hydroxylase NO66
MSDPNEGGTADGVVGRPALRRLVAGELDDFAAYRWGREPLLTRADRLPTTFADLLDASAVDELVGQRGLRTPFVRVACKGSTLPNASFTAGGGVGAGIADQVSDDKLSALFADGATIVLQGLHRTWPPLIRFVAQLATELGHPVQANAYVTPPQSQGFADHYDVHDVFVLQVDGEKSWRIHPPVLPAPLRDQPWTDHDREVSERAAEPPVLEAVLRPGDCLYLPRGYLHAATALGAVSTHLTLGVHTFTRYAIAEEVVRRALAELAADVDLRRSLDLGVDVGEPEQTSTELGLLRDRLVEAIVKVDGRAVADGLGATWRGAGRAEPIGPLAQLRASQQLAGDQVLRLRSHLVAQILEPADSGGPTGGSARLVSRAGQVSLDPDQEPAVRQLLRDGSASAADLGHELARRLLVAGVVVAPDGPMTP